MHAVVCPAKLMQVAAVVALVGSAHARANDCAGGMDATGNACNGEAAARTISATESNLLHLKAEARIASLRSIQAKEHQVEADSEVHSALTHLKAALKALSEAEKSARAR